MSEVLEIRVALVMNGGVSLAVWMAGVTHELDLLRRASKGLAAPDAPAECNVYDMWRDLCKDLNVKVTVDVVAGSSAGGVNGVLLATGIAQGAPLTQLREVWEETAQLDDDHLLWPVDLDNAPSVLNGNFFGDEIERIVTGIGPGSTDDSEEVTLFVTATAVGDQSRTVRDSDGVAFTVPDHRCLYRFGRQPRRVYRRDPDLVLAEEILDLFPPDEEPDPLRNSAALARAARATASFPGAFAPVSEKVFAGPRNLAGLEQYRVAGSDGAWLMDGGVLDNAPFGPVLEEIARRPVDDVWRRALVYVVPSVAAMAGDAAGADGAAPGWQHIVKETLFLPREVDLRSDVEALKDLLAEAERWGGGQQRLFAELRNSAGDKREDYRAAAGALFSSYRRSRTSGGIVDVYNVWTEDDAQDRIGLTPPTDVPETAAPEGWVPYSASEIDLHDTWNWGTAVADRVLRLMLRDLAVPENYPGLSSEGRRETLRVLSVRLECVTALRDAIVEQLRKSSPENPNATLAVNAINQAIIELRVGPTLVRLVREGAEAYAFATASAEDSASTSTEKPQSDAGSAEDVLSCALMAEVLAGAFTADQAFSRPVPFTFFRFGPDIDTPLFEVPDPKDRSKALPFGPWKLWGSQLGNFAAFGRSEWRENDWLWGRLDGAAHLVRLLISQAEQNADVDRDTSVALIQEKILAAHDVRAKEKFNRELQRMPLLTFQEVLRQWAGDANGRRSASQSLDSVLRTIRNTDSGNDSRIASVGELATILLGDKVPQDLHNNWNERAKRLASKVLRLRKRLQQYLLGE